METDGGAYPEGNPAYRYAKAREGEPIGPVPRGRGAGPGGYREADALIRDELCRRLAEDSQISAEGITVEVDNARVRLTGTVPHANMRDRANDLATGGMGVVDVDNRLRVSGAAPLQHIED